MLRIERIRTEVYNHDGTRDVVCDMQVSTAAELPAKDEQQDSIIYKPGCIAQIIESGQWATLDDDGKWYADGEEVSTEQASTLNMSPLTLGKSQTLAKAVAGSDGEYIDLTEPEVEAIRNELEGDEDAELL
jgi:hypothetical protein